MAHSAFFRRASSRLARALLVGMASSSLFLAGCDSATSKADKDITKQLDDASDLSGGSEANRVAAHQQLDAAAHDTTASLPVRLRAKSLLADSELRSAQELAGQVQSNDVLIDKLVREIGLLTEEIQDNNRRVAALQKYDPTALQALVAQKQTDAKGSDDKPDWYKSADVALPSLAADDKQAAALQSQISQMQDTIKSEMDQRNQLLEQSDKLVQQSYHEQKDKSVDLYVQGSDARKKAADLSVKLDQDNVALARAQADLAVRQGQHESLTTAIKGFDDKSAFFTQDWAAVQAKIADLNANSKKLMGDDPVNAPARDSKTRDLSTELTIGSKAAAITTLAKLNHDLRSIAETHFNSATGFYKDAEGLAKNLEAELGEKLSKKSDPAQSPDALAYTEEKAALHPAAFSFLLGDAEFQKAEFYARAASEYKTRLDLIDRVTPVMAAAQISVPPTLVDGDGSLAAQLKSAQASARDAFASSTDLLAKVAEGTGTQDQRMTAQVQEIFAEYAWWALETSAGDAQKAADHMSAARNAASAALADNATIPALPPELVTATPGAPATPPK